MRTIRPDGKIDAADPTIATCTGQMTVRFDGTTLVAEASSDDPISVEYGFSTAQGSLLTFAMPRVFLPQPKRSITGPGGVSVQYDWRAAYDESEDTLLKVTLVNEVASYACWTGKFRRWKRRVPACQHCARLLFIENMRCERCGHIRLQRSWCGRGSRSPMRLTA